MKRLLLADDDRALEPLFRIIFKKGDYEIDVAFDGRSTLSRIKETEYAAILLDLMMPEIGGIEVIERVVRDNPMTARRIIVMTAADPTIASSFDHDLVGAVVSKPFDVDRIRSLVDEIAGGSPAGAPPGH